MSTRCLLRRAGERVCLAGFPPMRDSGFSVRREPQAVLYHTRESTWRYGVILVRANEPDGVVMKRLESRHPAPDHLGRRRPIARGCWARTGSLLGGVTLAGDAVVRTRTARSRHSRDSRDGPDRDGRPRGLGPRIQGDANRSGSGVKGGVVAGSSSAGSRDSQRLLHRVWCAIDDDEIGSCWPFRHARAVFPVAQGVHAEAKPRRKRLLRQVQFQTDRPDIHVGRHVDTVRRLRLAALGVADRLIQALSNTVGENSLRNGLLAPRILLPGRFGRAGVRGRSKIPPRT